jgi:hypothetical protein
MCSAATPALNAGTSCGASSDEAAGDDVVGVSAQAASTPAMANADASRLMEVRDEVRDIDGSSLGTYYTSTRSSGRKQLDAYPACIALRARVGYGDVVERASYVEEGAVRLLTDQSSRSGRAGEGTVVEPSRDPQHTDVYRQRQEPGSAGDDAPARLPRLL